MKITVARKLLAEAVGASAFADTLVAETSFVWISGEGGKVVVRGSNLNCYTAQYIDGDVESEGLVGIHGRRLTAALRAIDADRVTIASDNPSAAEMLAGGYWCRFFEVHPGNAMPSAPWRRWHYAGNVSASKLSRCMQLVDSVVERQANFRHCDLRIVGRDGKIVATSASVSEFVEFDLGAKIPAVPACFDVSIHRNDARVASMFLSSINGGDVMVYYGKSCEPRQSDCMLIKHESGSHALHVMCNGASSPRPLYREMVKANKFQSFAVDRRELCGKLSLLSASNGTARIAVEGGVMQLESIGGVVGVSSRVECDMEDVSAPVMFVVQPKKLIEFLSCYAPSEARPRIFVASPDRDSGAVSVLSFEGDGWCGALAVSRGEL